MSHKTLPIIHEKEMWGRRFCGQINLVITLLKFYNLGKYIKGYEETCSKQNPINRASPTI